MPSRRELPRNFEPDPNDELAETGPSFVYIGHSDCRAENEWVALMECKPFADPDVSREERLVLRDIIVDAIDGLSEQEQWIFDALFVRKLSLRQLAAEIQMPKTTIARWRDSLLQSIRHKLVNEPLIADYLENL